MEYVTADDGYQIPLRIYRPLPIDAPHPRPILIYIHGGGFVLGGNFSHHGLCSDLAYLAEAVVVFVDYRLAPEYPYPIPLTDSQKGAIWVSENAKKLIQNVKTISMAGDR